MSASRPAPLLVSRTADLETLAERLRDERRIAIDTEAASFHRYIDRVYLLQISTDHETALIDPLEVPDLTPVGALLADPEIECILHDADYDLRILDRDYGFTGRRIWDTRVAAQLAGEKSFGLGALLEKHFGLRLSKELQRADWSMRPLTEPMIAYAAADTAHLPELRDLLETQLRDMGRLHWAEEEFLRLEGVRWTPRAAEGEEFLAMKGAKALRPPQLAVLRGLWEWRDERARDLDRAPFRIMGNEVLLALAKAAPVTQDALRRVPAMPARLAGRYGEELLPVIHAARALPESAWPRVERKRRERPDPDLEARLARLKALRAERAPAVGLDPGLVCPNAVLLAIARVVPTAADQLREIPDLRRWQREIMGDAAILAAVSESPG